MEGTFEVATNIGLIYKAKPYLDKDVLSALYLSYINYANLVWGSTHMTYLRKIDSQQEHALRLVNNRNRNLLNTAVLMHIWYKKCY